MQHDMEHWFTDKQTRLLIWRDWRQQLNQSNNIDALNEIARWWKFVPLVNKAIDPWREETWPNPWELVGHGEFCGSAQGLGIFYTLVLIGQDCDLVLAQLQDYPETKLLVVTPDKKVLNYYDGEVIDIDSTRMQMLRIWHPSDLARLVKV